MHPHPFLPSRIRLDRGFFLQTQVNADLSKSPLIGLPFPKGGDPTKKRLILGAILKAKEVGLLGKALEHVWIPPPLPPPPPRDEEEEQFSPANIFQVCRGETLLVSDVL